mgnify:CR=1 FL=1
MTSPAARLATPGRPPRLKLGTMNDERTFRLSEAQEMLPLLEALLAAAQALRLEATNIQALIQAVRRAASGDGSSLQTDTRELESKLRGVVETMHERVAAINVMGVQIKDLDRGLVDWVGLRDGRVVLNAPACELTLAHLDALYPDAGKSSRETEVDATT